MFILAANVVLLLFNKMSGVCLLKTPQRLSVILTILVLQNTHINNANVSTVNSGTVCLTMCLFCSLLSSSIAFPSLPLDMSNSCFCFNTWYFFYWKALFFGSSHSCSLFFFLNSVFLGGCLLPGYSNLFCLFL